MAIFGAGYGMPARAGLMVGGRRGLGGTTPTADPLTSSFKLYNTAVEQQAGDYGKIMEGYRNLLNRAPSSEFSGAVANLRDLATTGGLSEADAANIRARGISPIRAAYSVASRNIDRQRALQGGYSPGYGALQARLAREQSEQMAQGATNVEAELARLRQQGRLGAAGTYASAAGRESEIPMEALRGMTSLYGTTPALASLFGGQALSSAQLQQQINQAGQQGNLSLLGTMLGAFG